MSKRGKSAPGRVLLIPNQELPQRYNSRLITLYGWEKSEY